MNYLSNSALLKHKNIIVFVIYLSLIWLAYYFKFNKFGFYEDDYYIAGIPADSTFKELLKFIHYNLISFERNQGRFVAIILPFLITFINFKIGGVAALYIFGLLLVTLNAFLIFRIINKKFPFEIALLTGLVFALFPADTTKALIVHIYHLHISLVFTLLGMLCYVNNKKIVGFILAFTSLMNYENAFLPFIMTPFFTQSEWNKKIFMGWIRHLFIVATFLVILFGVRKIVGENIISNMDLKEFLRRTFISFAAGPATSIYSFLNAVIQSIINLKITWYIMLGALVVLSGMTAFWPTVLGSLKSNPEPVYVFKSGWRLSEEQLTIIKAITIGIAMSIIGYSFSFTHFPPTTLVGRITSVHFGAAFGISLMIAACIRLVLSFNFKPVWNRMISIVVILILSLCAGYGMLIQTDYIKSWDLQKKFWQGVVRECPDIKENTLVLVQKDHIAETNFVVSYSWAFPLIYDLIYEFPVNWKRDPILDLVDDTSMSITYGNGHFIYKPSYPFMFDDKVEVIFEKENLIFLKFEGDKLIRVRDTLVISPELEIPLKNPEKANVYPEDDLYQFIAGQKIGGVTNLRSCLSE